MEWLDFTIGFLAGAIVMLMIAVAWTFDAMGIHHE